MEIADDYVLPDTAPNQFDPDAMRRSAHLLRTLRPDAMLLSHFGRYPRDCDALSRRLEEQVDAFVALGRTDPQAPTWEQVHPRLTEHVRRDLAALGLPWNATVEGALAEFLEVAAQGIVDYHERRLRTG